MEWNSQRDQTQQLGDFKQLSLTDTKKVFFVPLHLLANLDDDPYGTSENDNGLKMLSARKVDKEGHSADAVADELFRIVLALRFTRRGESQLDSVRRLFEVLTEDRGEGTTNNCTVTTDRCYVKASCMEILTELGFSSVCLMPNHLLHVHSLAASSYLNPSSGDVKEGQEMGKATGNVLAVDTSENGDDGIASNVQLDRRRGFVVIENPQLGPKAFFATKNIGTSGTCVVAQNKTTAMAVWSQGMEKFAKLLRFMYTVLTSLQESLNLWIAVAKPNYSLNKVLYTRRSIEGGQVSELKTKLEQVIESTCVPLTVRQRCADWFLLRQGSVTGTNDGLKLLSSETAESALGIVGSRRESTLEDWFKLSYDARFSSKRSTEAIIRGTANEDAVLATLRALPFVENVFEAGWLAQKDAPHLACSPDGIVLLKKATLHCFSSAVASDAGPVRSSDNTFVLGTVEIKTRVAVSLLGQSVTVSKSEQVLCELVDAQFHTYFPEDHMAQILHHLLVPGLSCAVYVAATETGIL
ncbi:hypothetical protein BWQ96_05043 [Gracilariopsis chorda]|uniref:YqaJ viral recombinase domain-containing protein n=1 Tax=Gracilariopsis chorda TaxID=448386 RepID=A0A2V3ISW5_9FLOR|nr:hypothetical protein BWQ96_05043 [Gracilariopsis chorda]|eukprot:PXF45213.1 hypothetical protein BWQ96_05043 [Gracilariopsis chorda]